MNVGAAQVDITPASGGELSGFALRVQPSTGVNDPLFARALFLATEKTRLLWIHCDLIGFDARIPVAFRAWARAELGLSAAEVMLSATHTHSGPSTLDLAEAGAYDDGYVAVLHERLREAARLALRQLEPCTVSTAEGRLDLAVHRRGAATAHTDPRVGAVAFRRADGTFVAVIANYAIHPVALGPQNRRVSADLFGAAADELSRCLPGGPVALVTNGACGNLNPPDVGVTFEQAARWGRQIAHAAFNALRAAPVHADAALEVAVTRCALPLEVLDEARLDAAAKAILAAKEYAPWAEPLPRALARWRHTLRAAGPSLTHREIELFAVGIGPVIFVGANAELFSEYIDWLRRATGLAVYAVGYANGNWGYLAPRSAYAEGGYEVDSAHVFYGSHRFAAGALEQLADATIALLRRAFASRLSSAMPATADSPPSGRRAS